MGKLEDLLLTDGAKKIANGLSELAVGTTAYDVLVGITCFVAAYCETMHKKHSTFDIHRFYGDLMRSLVEMRCIVDEIVDEMRSKKSKDEDGKATANNK